VKWTTAILDIGVMLAGENGRRQFLDIGVMLKWTTAILDVGVMLA